ncbi:MAG: ABC transporter permease [Anaerolineae bacterium]
MSWHKIWVIARHEFLTNVKRPGFIIMTAIVPAMGALGLLVATVFGGEAQQIGEFLERQFTGDKPYGVVDQSGSFTPIQVEYQEDFVPYSSEEAAADALEADDISEALIIPQDYLETGQIIVLTQGSGFGAAEVSDSAEVRAFFVDHLLAGRVDDEIRFRAADPVRAEPRVISGGRTQGEGPLGFVFTFVVPYVLSFFLIMTIFVSSGYLLRSVAEEKETRVVEIVISSVRPMELMAGKVAGLGALGLTQVLIWLLSVVAFSGGLVAVMAVAGAFLIPARILVLGVVYYLLGYTMYAILMAGIGALGATSQESQQLAGIFSFFAAIPYMLSGLLFVNPNAMVTRVLSFFPLTAPTMMMLRLPLADVPWVDVAGSITSLIVFTPVALWASAKLFRVGLLIYGKRPTVKEIWGILTS